MADIEQIDPAGAYERIQAGTPYLDVRTVGEYEDGHAQGAHNIPVFFNGAMGMQPNPDFVEQVKARFQPDQALVVGCRTGGRSQQAAELLAQAGFTSLANDQGSWAGRPGVPGWSLIPELPTETGNPEGRAFDGPG